MKILHIFFNEFSEHPLRYGITVTDGNGAVTKQIDLKRAPRGKYDEVRECGCGAKSVEHLNWCTRQARVYGHRLERA